MSDLNWWEYDQLKSGHPYDWTPANKGEDGLDQIDFHLDLGCGTGVKKARLGIDRFAAPDVDLLIDLETLTPTGTGEAYERTWELYEHAPFVPGLPFPDKSIESIISHHCLEHIGPGFLRLMDECHRVLTPGGIFRIIVPFFPSYAAVADPDHKRYFCEGVFETFCGAADGAHWMESFSVPYTNCRFEMLDADHTGEEDLAPGWTPFGPMDVREMRVALRRRDL